MKNKKGFTLIELLAVIVILGLLLLISVPSITKYINESRKRTLTTTIKSYVSALSLEVNNMKYSFNEQNTIYAVPIECISLEKGGTNSFGEWKQVNDNYFAYVLVQYDSENSSYKYGFTFKDSSGNVLMPITQDLLNKNGEQIENGLNLNKPLDGRAIDLMDLEMWKRSGFKVKQNTKLKTLIPTSKIEEGNEEKKCTLVQNDNDYIEDETEKYYIGKEYCFVKECFYLIDSDLETVTLLSKDRIDTTTYRQSGTTGNSGFTRTLYWTDGTNLKPEYGTKYTTYVYDSNSSIYSCLENYKSYLLSLNFSSIEIKLISYEQLINTLGCKDNDCNNSEHKNWIVKNYDWWTGSAAARTDVWRVLSTGKLGHHNGYTFSFGIRPIIKILKSDI